MIKDFIHLISKNGIPIFEHHIQHEGSIKYCDTLNQDKINGFYRLLNQLTAEYAGFFEEKVGKIVEQEIKECLENFEYKDKKLWICGFKINYSFRGNPYLYLDENFGEKNFGPHALESCYEDQDIENKFYQQVLCPLFTKKNSKKEQMEELIKEYPTPKEKLYRFLGKSIERR